MPISSVQSPQPRNQCCEVNGSLRARTSTPSVRRGRPGESSTPPLSCGRGASSIPGPAALAESGDLLLPMQEGAIDATHIAGEIGEVFAGLVPGRTRPDEVTLFKSLEMAVEDVVAAHFVYTRALQENRGQEVRLD